MKSLFRRLFPKRSSSHPLGAPVDADAREKAAPEEEQLIFAASSDKRAPSIEQLRYLPHLLNRPQLIAFLISAVILIIGTPVLAVRGYYAATEEVAAPGGSYTEGLVGTPQHLNPLIQISDVEADIGSLIFSSIFRYDSEQNLEPDLITNYIISEDQLEYTFFLKRGVQWHDGEALTADDVIFTIQSIQDPLYQSPLQPTLKGVGIEKIDEYTVKLILSEPFAPFLTTLTFGILPEHLWFSVPAQNVRLTELNLKPVGSGPYKFAELTKDREGNLKSFVIERNDEYYGDIPYLDQVNFLFYADQPTAVDALKTKKVEGLGFFPVDERNDIERRNGDVEFRGLRIPQYTALFFNQDNSEVLQDDAVRQAVATSIDRTTVVNDVFQGQAEEIFTPILPGYLGHNAEVEKYPFDIDAAAALLQENGWVIPDGAEADENGLIARENDGQKLEFTISTVDVVEYRQTLDQFRDAWRQIGAKVNIDYYSAEDIQSQVIRTRNYEALLFGQIVGNDPDPYPFWHSSQQEHPGLALAIFSDKEVDQLLEEARKSSDDEERRTRYLHIQNNIAEEVPAVFLYNPFYTYAVHKKINGINEQQYITIPSDRFTGLPEWYIKTNRRWK